MKFTARVTKPTKGNKFYTRTASGGYSGAVQGKPTDECDALANCVGYSYGRIAEASGRKSCDLCEPTNPGYFDKYLYNGCTKGQTPKLGAIIVWTKDGGKESEGHVGNVEAILDENTIVTSESHYGGSAFDLNIHELKNGKKYYKSGYTFKCFIYSPFIETPEDEIFELKGRLTDYQVDYDAKCAELKTEKAKTEALTKDKTSLTNELNTAKNTLKTANEKAESLTSEINVLKTTNGQLQKDLSTAKNALTTANTLNEKFETSYNMMATEIGNLKKDVGFYKKNCVNYGTCLEESFAETEELKKKIEDQQFAINEFVAEIKDLEATDNDNKTKIDDLAHRLQIKVQEIDAMKENRYDLNGDGKVDLQDVWLLIKAIFKK